MALKRSNSSLARSPKTMDLSGSTLIQALQDPGTKEAMTAEGIREKLIAAASKDRPDAEEVKQLSIRLAILTMSDRSEVTPSLLIKYVEQVGKLMGWQAQEEVKEESFEDQLKKKREARGVSSERIEEKDVG